MLGIQVDPGMVDKCAVIVTICQCGPTEVLECVSMCPNKRLRIPWRLHASPPCIIEVSFLGEVEFPAHLMPLLVHQSHRLDCRST